MYIFGQMAQRILSRLAADHDLCDHWTNAEIVLEAAQYVRPTALEAHLSAHQFLRDVAILTEVHVSDIDTLAPFYFLAAVVRMRPYGTKSVDVCAFSAESRTSAVSHTTYMQLRILYVMMHVRLQHIFRETFSYHTLIDDMAKLCECLGIWRGSDVTALMVRQAQEHLHVPDETDSVALLEILRCAIIELR